jgi:hypothetical protein
VSFAISAGRAAPAAGRAAIRVMLCDDSAVARGALARLLAQDAALSVVA